MPTKWCHGVPAGIPWELTITTDGVSSPTRKSPGELRKIPVFTAPHVFAVTSSPSLLLFIQSSALRVSGVFLHHFSGK